MYIKYSAIVRSSIVNSRERARARSGTMTTPRFSPTENSISSIIYHGAKKKKIIVLAWAARDRWVIRFFYCT